MSTSQSYPSFSRKHTPSRTPTPALAPNWGEKLSHRTSARLAAIEKLTRLTEASAGREKEIRGQPSRSGAEVVKPLFSTLPAQGKGEGFAAPRPSHDSGMGIFPASLAARKVRRRQLSARKIPIATASSKDSTTQLQAPTASSYPTMEPPPNP